jgi:hypothetical protein
MKAPVLDLRLPEHSSTGRRRASRIAEAPRDRRHFLHASRAPAAEALSEARRIRFHANRSMNDQPPELADFFRKRSPWHVDC